MSVSINWGSFLAGALQIGIYTEPLIVGNSHVGSFTENHRSPNRRQNWLKIRKLPCPAHIAVGLNCYSQNECNLHRYQHNDLNRTLMIASLRSLEPSGVVPVWSP